MPFPYRCLTPSFKLKTSPSMIVNTLIERLRKLKKASEALETSQLSQGGAPAAQAAGQEESNQVTNVSSPDEEKKREVSDPVKLAAYSIGAADFLDAMQVLVPTLFK